MDRLTHTNRGMAWYKSDMLLLEPHELTYPQIGEVLRRLAAYEDTGLTPEEIKAATGTGKKAYIAGKISGDPRYKLKFEQEARRFEKAGYKVINPATLPEGMSHADYMRICFSMLDVADVVVFLPDWKESPGAKLERAWCEYTGKSIVEYDLRADVCVCCGAIIPEGRHICHACEMRVGL